MLSLQEALTENFYHWERRGRGWKVWNEPVELEPPFEPFFHQYVRTAPATDDGRKPSLVGSWIGRLQTRLSGSPNDSVTPGIYIVAEEPEPRGFHDTSPLKEIQISLPGDLRITKEAAEHFLLSLSSISRPVAFEVIGTRESITLQIVCRNQDSVLVQGQLKAYFPEAVIAITNDALRRHWDEEAENVVIDFGLSQEFMRPLRIFKGFEADPLIAIAGALGNLGEGEIGVVQILFQAVHNPWADNIMRAVTNWDGHSFFMDAPEMSGLAREKLEHALFAVVLRVAALSPNASRTIEIAISLGGALAQFARPGSNELIPLDNDEYDDIDHEFDLLSRQSHRSGMLLNSSELVSLVHLPSISVRAEKLQRQLKRSKLAPSVALGHQLVLGENEHQGKVATVTLSPEQRLRHTYVIGATGTGKSTLLLNMIIQDIKNGMGIGVLDPQGDLIDQVLGHIPESRFDDVILLDPADSDYPVGFNILSAHSELEKNILSSDLGAVFRRLSTSWGDQMTSVLGNAILAFLESKKGGTLVDLRRFLIDQDFRRAFLPTVRDPEVIFYWQKEFPLLSGKPQGPVLTRLDSFLRPKLIRNMVAQKDNKIDFHKILNEGKILLVKLAQGLIGEENAYLLGSFIVSKLHQAAMSRQEFLESERKDFCLYVDEFQNFITPSMASILSGARKYHLGLILAHQDLHQLWNRDTEVAGAVISNPCTRVCFRLGDFDAKKLEDGFSFFEADDLQNLGTGEAICRIERAEYDFNLKTLAVPAVDTDLARHRRGQLIVLSREKYARRRADVEAEVFKEPREATAPATSLKELAKQEKEEALPKDRPLRAAKRAAKERSILYPVEVPALGRGGQQHKYLQHLLKRMGESKGYRVTIEKQILGGLGSADVTLERDGGKSIACEICVTTSVEHELGNIQKCLAAGFGTVVLVCSDRKILNGAKDSVAQAVSEKDSERVRFFMPEEFLMFLEDQEAQAANKEERVRGYRVKVKYRPIDESQKKAKKQAIAQTILEALRRMREH